MIPPPLHAERDLVLTTVAGSTTHRPGEVAQLVAWALDLQAKQHAAGIEAGRRAKERSEALRSAIRQAAGREPVKAGPFPGQYMQPIELDAHCVVKVLRRLTANPAHFGVNKAPGERVVRDELSKLKK